MSYFFIKADGHRLNIAEVRPDGAHPKRLMLTRDSGLPLVLDGTQVRELISSGKIHDQENTEYHVFLPAFVSYEDLKVDMI